MITKESIIKMSRHVFRRNQGRSDRRLIHPSREWWAGFVIVTLLFIVSAACIGYLFTEQLHSDGRVQYVGEMPILYDQEKAQKILKQYARRQEQFESLRSKGTSVSMPIVDTSNADDDGVNEKETPQGIMME